MEQIFDIFHVASWFEALVVALDLAIVYYVIYRLLLLIKGTKAVRMVFGLMLIVLFFLLSQEKVLNLSATHWIIEQFITNFIIIVVIIFQDDLRRALAQFGQPSLFPRAQTIEETQILEEVIKAAVMLSSRKIGALIVIEREADLTHYIEEGIKIGSDVTKEVLFNVFLPEHQNPLHDGATIIRDGKIAAAGCVLPLTTDPNVEKALGTRHRAGIGLSEDTDAAVVVVSEETGTISVAHRGTLEPRLDANQLRELLQTIFSARTLSVDEEELMDQFREQRQEESDSDAEEGET